MRGIGYDPDAAARIRLADGVGGGGRGREALLGIGRGTRARRCLRADRAQQLDRALASLSADDLLHEFAEHERVRLREEFFPLAREPVKPRRLAAGVALGTDVRDD